MKPPVPVPWALRIIFVLWFLVACGWLGVNIAMGITSSPIPGLVNMSVLLASAASYGLQMIAVSLMLVFACFAEASDTHAARFCSMVVSWVLGGSWVLINYFLVYQMLVNKPTTSQIAIGTLRSMMCFPHDETWCHMMTAVGVLSCVMGGAQGLCLLWSVYRLLTHLWADPPSFDFSRWIYMLWQTAALLAFGVWAGATVVVDLERDLFVQDIILLFIEPFFVILVALALLCTALTVFQTNKLWTSVAALFTFVAAAAMGSTYAYNYRHVYDQGTDFLGQNPCGNIKQWDIFADSDLCKAEKIKMYAIGVLLGALTMLHLHSVLMLLLKKHWDTSPIFASWEAGVPSWVHAQGVVSDNVRKPRGGGGGKYGADAPLIMPGDSDHAEGYYSYHH